MNTLSGKYVGEIVDKIEHEGYLPSDAELKAVQEYCLFALYFMYDRTWIVKYQELNLPKIPNRLTEEFGKIDMYVDQVNRFPPDVQKIAKLFFEEFLIPPGAIPTPKKSKNSKFAQWVKQLRYLDEVGGSYSSRAMPKAFKKWKDAGTPIARPAAINSYFTTAVSDVMREDEEIRKSLDIENKKTSSDIDEVLEIGKMFDEV